MSATAEETLPQRGTRVLADGLATVGRSIMEAFRILGDHWPQLVGLFLMGWTGRMGFLWLATAVSKWNSTLAVLILPLAPMCTIVAIVLMLRVVSDTVPALGVVFDGRSARERWHEHLTVVGQVMLPALAVYASQGMLRRDAQVFLVDTTMDELRNSMIPQWDRALYAQGAWLVVMILAVLALRKIISITGWTKTSLAASGFAAYLEALWLVTLAQSLSSNIDKLKEWVLSRAVVDGAIRSVQGFVDWLGVIGTAIRGLVTAITTLLTSGFSIIIIPVSLLAVAATVYGRELHAGEPIPTHETVTKRLEKVPNPIRRVFGQVVEPITTPVESAWTALTRAGASGVIPTLIFCLIFVLLNQLENVVALLARAIIGPQSDMITFATEPYVNLVRQLIFMVVAIPLLTATVTSVTAQSTADEVPARAA